MAWSCVEHVLDVRGNVGSVLGKCKTLRIQTAWFTLCSAVFTVRMYISNSAFCPQCIFVFCMGLGTNSDYFPIHRQLTGFYNRDGVCLLRGTDGVFIYNSGLRKSLRSAHTLYLCLLCGSQNKQRLFPYTTLTGFYNRDGVFTARYGLGI